jgi:hypothetical protein
MRTEQGREIDSHPTVTESGRLTHDQHAADELHVFVRDLHA